MDCRSNRKVENPYGQSVGVEQSVTAGDATGSLAAESLLRPIGRSGITTSPLTLGAAVFGWTVPNGRAKELLDRYTALGGTMVDTADSYSSGMSEQIIGSWMRERKNRDEIVLATKVGRHPDNEGLSGRNIRAAVDASLERLQTDRIDLLYFHADDPTTPLEESLAAVAGLVDAGKVRALGASNFSAGRLLEARVLSSAGLPRVEAAALEYSLMRREIVEGDVAMTCLAQGISLMPYFVLANGYLGRLRNIKDYKPGDMRGRRAASHSGRHGASVLRVLDDVAMAHGVEASTVAVAWVLQRPGIGPVTIGPESVTDLEALMHAPSIRLTRQQIGDLDRVSATQQRTWTQSLRTPTPRKK